MSQINQRKRKFLVCLIIIAMMVVMLPALALAGQASDISTHWAKDQINDWVNKGLVKGYPDGTFKPENNISRAEFMALINGAFGYMEKVTIDYKDVAAGAWYADVVAKAQAAGYISGYSDGTIKPNSPISRQEAAIVIMKINQLEPNVAAADRFKDTVSIATWSKGAVGAAVTANIMSGYPDGTFKANNPIKRAEAVVALSKALSSKITAPVSPTDGSVIYHLAGTYGSATGTATIKGNVTIKAKAITLQNTIIEGDLTIDKAVGEGNVTLKKVVVKGNTYVYGGGTNSIYFIDTQTGQTYVMKDNGPVRIVASGSSEISQLIAQSNVKVQEVDLTGKGFEGIIVDKKVDGKIDINLAGVKVTNLEVKSEGVTIKTDKDTNITTLIADAKVAVTGAGTVAKAKINASGVSFDTKPTSQTVAPGVSAPTINTSTSSSGGGGGGSNTVTTASVSTAAELNTALNNANITIITLTGNITASPTVTRSLTMNFGAYTLTGNLSFNHTGTGTSILTGNAGNRIIGTLTVNTANASFNNGVNVSGAVIVTNVATASWTESADGNILTITDPDGATITIVGDPGSVTVTQDAGGNLTLTVNPGATVTSISSSAPVNIVVAAGAAVTEITAAAGSDGTTITNNGTTGTLTVNAPINLVANVAPTTTTVGASGSAVITGTNAGGVTVVDVSAISVNPTTLNLTAGGATGTITATVTPDNATNKTVNWSSSDINVATVATGVVTPVAAGTATITATSAADRTKTATTAVTVNAVVTDPVVDATNSDAWLISDNQDGTALIGVNVFDDEHVAIESFVAADFAVHTNGTTNNVGTIDSVIYTHGGTYNLTLSDADGNYNVDVKVADVLVQANLAVTISTAAPTSPLASFTAVTLTQTGDVANGNVKYVNAAAVIAALPIEIAVTLVDNSIVNVPVSWADTDTYNAGVATDYTFTATWGEMPAGANNDNTLAAPTVEVTVAAKAEYAGGVATVPTVAAGTPPTTDTITLTALAATYEYAITDIDGTSCQSPAWQDSNVFTALTANTTYRFKSRVKETATTLASDLSTESDNIKTAALSADAGLTSILGETDVSPAGEAGSATGTPITWIINVANAEDELAVGQIVAAANATANLYSDAGFTANEDAVIALTEGGAIVAYIKVTAQNGDILYYAVTINRAAAAAVTGISGVVRTSSGDHSPIEGVNVSISNHSTVTNANGEYSISDAPDGSQWISLYADFYYHGSTPAQVNVPGTYDAYMQPAGKITGTITLQGTLPTGKYIKAQISEHNNLDDAIVSESNFTVRGVPVGINTLSFYLYDPVGLQQVYISPTSNDHSLTTGVTLNVGDANPVTNSTISVPVTHPDGGSDDGIIDIGTVKLIYSEQ